MNKPSLKDRLYNFLKKNPTWIASGEIQRMVVLKTSYTAQNVGRRLRELENEYLIEVSYRKGHAWYKVK